MQTLSADNVKKLLQELSTSSFRFERRAAAYKLGQLAISNDEIVRALATAVALDDEAEVRSAALQALQSPKHQAFLKDHPDFIQEVTKSAAHKQAQEKQQTEKEISGEYLRRRTRQRIFILIFFGGVPVLYCTFMVGLFQGWQGQASVTTWVIGFIAFYILFAYVSWRNWRCPACDSSLGLFRYQINPILTPDIVHCPSCGTKLL